METNTELKMIHLSEVESQQIKWLWYPFIPYGKLSIVQGDPGDGKSTLILNIAAKLSRGECIDESLCLQGFYSFSFIGLHFHCIIFLQLFCDRLLYVDCWYN